MRGRLTYRFLRGIMRSLTALILGAHVHVEGLDNVPREGAALVVGNHVGMIDPPLTGSLIRRDDVHYMAKSEQFENAALRRLFHGFQAFPVVRGSPDRVALRHTLELLGAGHVVLVYPEGSRSPDGHLRPAQAGIGFIARHAGAPVIPVAIWGTERVLPHGSRRPRRAHVTVRFGAPVPLPAGRERAQADNRAVADAIMAAVAEMLPAAYRPLAPPASAA